MYSTKIYATDIGCGKDKNMLARLIIPLQVKLDFSILDSCDEKRKIVKKSIPGNFNKQIKHMLNLFK